MDNKTFSLADEFPPSIENGNHERGDGRLSYPPELTRRGDKTEDSNGKQQIPREVAVQEKEEEEDGTEYMCGAFNRYPKWLQRFADPRWFLVAYCVQNLISGAEGTFLIGCTTSIEKHFQFSSGDMGFIMLLGEIGPVITTILLSFVGGRGNRPRWLAIGLALGGIGVLIIFSTFLFYPAPVLSESGLLENSKKFCDIQDVINFQFLNSTTMSSVELAAISSTEGADGKCGHSNGSAFSIWMVGFTLKAMAGTILFTIGAPYLDDSISKNLSPIYFSISISVRILGPTIGFSLSALALNTYVYPGKNYGITAYDPRWIGAWWTGPLVFSILMISYAFTLSLFPRKMKRPELAKDIEEQSPGDKGRPSLESLTDEELVKTSVVPTDEEEEHPRTNRCHIGQFQKSEFEAHLQNNDFETQLRKSGLRRPRQRNGSVLTWEQVVGNQNESTDSEYVNGHAQGVHGRDVFGKNNGHPPGDVSALQEIPRELSSLSIKKRNYVDRFMSEEQKTNIREFLEAVRRISKNPVVTYGAVSDFMSLVAEFGMFLWLAKYQEHQFRTTKSTSTFFSGISGTSSILIGVLGGGFWIYRFRPNGRTVAYVTTLCLAIYMLCLIGLMFVTCDFQEDLPGILSPDAKSIELYRGCSSGCNCDLKEFIPVCVRDGPISLTYFSPCHAGCPNSSHAQTSHLLESSAAEFASDEERPEIFYNCTCGSPSANVTSGYCQDTCSGFLAYNIITTIVRALISTSIIGGMLLNMRCVAVEDKALALGVKASMVSAALIVNPLIYSSLVDSSCLVWEETCEGLGSCWLYNTDDFSYKLHGVSAIFIFFSVVFSFALATKVGDLQLLDDEKPSPSTPSPSSPASSFLFSSGPGRKRSSLRRSLKKISRLVGRENGTSRSPGRKKEGKEDDQTQREAASDDRQEVDTRGENGTAQEIENSAIPSTQEPSFSAPTGNILPSRVVKTTGV